MSKPSCSRQKRLPGRQIRPMQVLDEDCHRTIILSGVDDAQDLHADAESIGGAEVSKLPSQLEGDILCEFIRFCSKNLQVLRQQTELVVDEPCLAAARLTLDPDHLGLP